MSKEPGEPRQEAGDRALLITKLTDPSTTLEERILASRELFPEERKREILARADKDRKGRPVRYFRGMSYEELGAILESNEGLSVNLNSDKEFKRKQKEIQFSLKSFLQNEGLYDELKLDFNELCSDFTLDNFSNFIRSKLPLVKLLKLHQTGSYLDSVDATGLKSLSIGSPVQPPLDPFKDKSGIPTVEFSIPTEEVVISPSSNNLGLQEREKEANVMTLKPEWIVDVYNGTQDFAQRFFNDPDSVLYSAYLEQKEKDSLIQTLGYVGENSMWDILKKWIDSEKLADLIPTQKMLDLDGTNPDLQKPLIQE